MEDTDSPTGGFVDPEIAAVMLGTAVDEVYALVDRGEIRGLRTGVPARWRIETASVEAYLDDQAEVARRSALWRQSQEASFPELWGRGDVRHPD